MIRAALRIVFDHYLDVASTRLARRLHWPL